MRKLSSGRTALPVGGGILGQESGSGLSLPGEVTTLGNRLDREGLPRKITCMSFVPTFLDHKTELSFSQLSSILVGTQPMLESKT